MKSRSRRWVIKAIGDPVILNWSEIQKCILIFVFFLFIKVLWVSWHIYTLSTPEFYPFVNLEALRFHLKLEIIELFVFVFLIQYFNSSRNDQHAQQFLPYVCMIFSTTSLVFDSYSSGLLATGTIVNAMSFIYLIVVLFEKRVLFFAFCYSFCIFFFFIRSGMVTGEFQYAPIFNLANIGYPNFLNHFWLSSTIFFSVPPLAIGLFIFATILKQWHQRETYITELSEMDSLTGIYNRRVLTKHLLALDRNSNDIQSFAIILMDLDYFKKVNDTYGHLMGDRVLVKTAEILRSSLRATDFLGRYGGEEFLIIITNTKKEEILRLAERCRQALENYEHVVYQGQNKDQKISVTSSIGIAYVEQNMSAMQAVHAADLALYKAKANGRNQICFG
ncbi:GGDEF domain-containing protein [Acinetobacter shaoyimingii]|uniref:diguanylate cyclase n=1 Tax=Acinetobacter shaoyimingii TaxID=2715164 RepID=A0A6G8RW53_9GAMM|nr:GGDEF domain-containing protein [Acinetobacter shaoyimingii]QIO06115.1 GGDEF domain-containing protein [Acinetobacter shaoyimingii]